MSQKSYLIAIKDAERDLEKLRKEQAALLKRIDALEKFIQSGRALAGQAPPAASPLLEKNLQVPIADHVAEILKAAGKPLHLREIVEQLRAKRTFGGKDPADSVAMALKRRARQFKRVGPNTFTLAKQRNG
jgi:hypothetical protein